MNDKDIQQFIHALRDFIQHAEVEDMFQDMNNSAQLYYEQKAAELEVTVDYYLMEFV
jgi:hypothetical protein